MPDPSSTPSAHLSNFGMYASPERRLVFDLNDFDETLPGPWEWDVKRLAVSFFIAGRFNGLDKQRSGDLAQRVVRVYRKAMNKLAGRRVMDVWYSLLEVEHLLKQFRPIDFAIKVVGVGSVGTRCAILLLEGRDRKNPLFLQIKEANRSVLEEFLPKSRYEKCGRRVVEGQRLMQTVSDIFLGYIKGETGRDYYVRQLKDWKGSDDVENATEESLKGFANARGWTPARAHARAGDPIAIAGYLGEDKTIDRAIGAFAERYAMQNARDYDASMTEIHSGRLEAQEYEA